MIGSPLLLLGVAVAMATALGTVIPMLTDEGVVAVPERKPAAAGAPAPPPVTSRPGTSRPCPVYAPPAGFGRLIVADDFEGDALDRTKWDVYDDPDGQFPRTPAAVSVAGGELRLTGGFRPDGRDMSGGIASPVNFRYGHVDVCFRVDRGAGYSGVVLLWPESEKWPDDGEINLAEVNEGSRQSAMNFVHNTADDFKAGHRMIADFTQWHVVSVDWLPDRIVYYLDGKVQWVAGLDADTRGIVPGTSPMHLTLQLDKGCDSFIECRNAQTPPQVVMHTAWVRVYARS